MVRQSANADARTAAEKTTPEDAAIHFTLYPSQAQFDHIVAAVEAEYDEDGHDPVGGNGNTDTDVATVLTPTGLAVQLAAEARGFDAASMIDFDGADEVSVPYDSFEEDDPHATPIEVVQIAGFAETTTDRTVRFRDGAGTVRIYVDTDRRDD